MELVFICVVCIVIGIIIGENSSSSKRRSYENRNPPGDGPPPLKLKKSLRLDETSVQRTHNKDGPLTPKPEITPKGQSRKRRFSDDEIEDMLREAYIRAIRDGDVNP